MPIKLASEANMMITVLGLGIVIISLLFSISLYFIKKHLSKGDAVGDQLNEVLTKLAEHDVNDRNLKDTVDDLGQRFDYIDGRVQDLGNSLSKTYTKVAVLDERMNNFSSFQKLLQNRD